MSCYCGNKLDVPHVLEVIITIPNSLAFRGIRSDRWKGNRKPENSPGDPIRMCGAFCHRADPGWTPFQFRLAFHLCSFSRDERRQATLLPQLRTCCICIWTFRIPRWQSHRIPFERCIRGWVAPLGLFAPVFTVIARDEKLETNDRRLVSPEAIYGAVTGPVSGLAKGRTTSILFRHRLWCLEQ